MLLAATGCGDPAPELVGAQPDGWDDEIRLREAVDEDPDPDVVEIHLTAKLAELELLAGKKTPVWTYDGAIPGPLIHVKKGDHLIVHFTNDLPEETTVHWHGIRVPNGMDGVPGTSAPAIPPGGTFDYEFDLPDAGLYWYHPHFDSAAQVGNGLYGAILVDDPDEPKDLGDEVVLVLSDIHIDDATGGLEPPDTSGELGSIFGREGNHILVNGKMRPTLRATAGLRQRWRVVDAAKSRYFQLELAEHDFTVIGADGGFASRPAELPRLLLTPGQRADVLVTPNGEPGTALVVRWIPFDRGYGTADFRSTEDVFEIALAPDVRGASPPMPSIARDIEPLSLAGATPVEIRLTQGMDANGKTFLGINDKPFPEADPVDAAVGETQIWTLKNEMDWAHPFHLHGFFFQVLDDPEPLAWRDTVNVPQQETRRIAVRYDDRPGMWMFHCHILDHADMGMMGMLMLHEP